MFHLPYLQGPDTDRTLDSCNLHCVPKEFQRYRHQDLWTCVLQRLRRRTAYVKIPQMSELQQVFWKQRSHEGHSLSLLPTMYNTFRLLVTTSMSVCVVAFYWSGI